MNDTPSLLENRLKILYDQEKISTGHFDCKNRGVCEKAAGKTVLSRGSEAYVGARYGTVLKVVILSPDASGASLDLSVRRESAVSWEGDGGATYMNAILHLVQKLLAKEVSGQPLHHYFAMIESAKCSSSLEGAPEPLHNICQSFARSELIALEPDLVVTIGKRTQPVLSEFPTRDVDVNGLLTLANEAGDTQVFDFNTLDWLTTVSARYLSGLSIGEHNAIALHVPRPSDPAWEQFSQLHLPVCAWLVRELVSRQGKQ